MNEIRTGLRLRQMEHVRGQFQPVKGEPNHDGDHKTFEETAST